MKPLQNSIKVILNTLAGIIVDVSTLADGRIISYRASTNEYTHIDLPTVTYETLLANGDIGTGATQVAQGNHLHTGVYEVLTNKENTTLDNSTTKYPTLNLVKTYTDAKVANSITSGVTTIAPSQGAVFTALAGKENTGVAASLDVTVLSSAKSYADSLVVGLWDDRGNFNASVNTFPTAGGSGTAGAILKGDVWTINVVATSGPLIGYPIGTIIRALVDTPAQVGSSWSITGVGMGYVAENVSNKVTTITGASTDVQYPSAKLLYDQLALKQAAGTYSTDIHSNIVALNAVSGSNTGDAAINTTSNSYADGKVVNAINSGVTTTAPSQGAVYTALAGKQPVGSYLVAADIAGKEDSANKVTTISGASTNVQYPSAKLLYDQLALKQPSGTYSTDIHANITALNAVSGVNTGDGSGHTGLVPYTGATGNVDLGTYAIKGSKFQLNTSAVNTLVAGEFGWNTHDRTMELKLNSNVTLQIGQEHSFPVQNNTGGTLLDGRLVRIVGHDIATEYYQVAYSDNSTEATAYVDFMLTESIPDGGVGFGTKTGVVHDINTIGGVLGTVAYLGTTGQFQPTVPSYPNKGVIVGYYGHISATIGEMLVDFNRASQYNINLLSNGLELKQMQNPGIDQAQALFPNDIVINTTALTLTIATVKNGQAITPANPIRYYTDGAGAITQHELTTAFTFPAFTNTTGIWYFYFDSSGTAITTQTPWTDLSTIATIYRFYWNATLSGAARLVIESQEFHQNDISATDHTWKHAQGSIYVSGLDIVYNVTGGTPAVNGSNSVISLTTGKCSDDGLEWTVTNTSTPVNYFEQNMGNITAGTLTSTNSGLFKIRTNDTGGILNILPATRFPFLWNSVNNRPQYLTTTGVATDMPNANYMVYYVYNLSDRGVGSTIKIVSAEAPFASLTSAQSHSWETMRALYATLKDNEIRPLYKLIFYVKHSNPQPYDVACKYTALHQVDDIRRQLTAALLASSGSVLASNVLVAPAGNISSSNVQEALVELDTEKVPYTGASGNVDLGAFSLISPKLIGGSLTTSALYLQTTSGIGTTGADMHFLVGNNGGTEAMTILNSGLIVLSSLATAATTIVTASTTGQLSTTANNSTNWNTAFSQSRQWDGGATGLVAGTGRTSLGGTTIGQAMFVLTNPTAITFPRFNADNTVSALDAATFRTAIGAGTSSTVGTVTSVAALTLSATGTDLSSTVATGTTTPVITLNVPTASAANRGVLSTTDWTRFDTAYSDRNKWDGGSTGLVAATGRTSLGGTTVGQNFFVLTNPTAITFPRINADNTVSALDAATFRTAIGAGTSSTVGTVTSVAALTIGTTGTDVSSTVATGTTTPVITLNIPTASASNRGALSTTDWSSFNSKVSNSTHTGDATGSVALVVVALNGTNLAALATGLLKNTTGTGVPTIITDNSTNWNTAFTNTLNWNGGSTSLVAATGRTSLGGTTVGQSFFTLVNPTAITFARINADNSVSALDAATFRTAIGAGTSSTVGTVTSVAALTLGTTGTDVSSSVATGTTTPVITLNIPTASASNRGALSATDWTTFNNKSNTTGTVTNVAMTVPTGLTIGGTPITTTGTLALTYTSGYAIPTTAKQTQWDTAYTYSQVGHLPLAGGTLTGQLNINTGSPTICMQDTNERSAFMHVNGNTFYVLRGAGTNSTTWSQYNGQWPLTLNLENNAAVLGGDVSVPAGTITANAIAGVRNAINSITNNLGSPTVEEMALIHGQFTNKFRFLPAFTQEESANGTTWVTSTRASSAVLADIMIGEGQTSSFTACPTTVGGNSYYRLTWDATQTGYVFLNALYIYNSTNGLTVNIIVEVYDPIHGWVAITSGTTTNWPGHCYIPHSSVAFLPNADGTSSHRGKIRISFSIINSPNTNGFQIYGIEWFGGYPAGQRNVQSYDRNRNVSFPGTIGGTQLSSSIAIGTAPLVVTSTTLVSNLNADLLDGNHADAFALTGHTHAGVYEPANANIQSHIASTSNPHSTNATQVGLGNVANESKATMFTNAALTGTPTSTTAVVGTNTTQIATTAFVQSAIGLVGGGTVMSVAALTLGTSGTDLSSTVANSTSTPVITLNVPTASAANRGVLSAADWSTFNGKQTSVLTSGNILVGNASNVATSVALSGDASLSNTGVLSIDKTRLNVRNETGTIIASTRAVYVSGFNNFPLITLATNTVETSHNVVGITIAPIGTSANGFIAVSGQCDAETNGWPVGTEVYLSTGGLLTSTTPTSGNVRHVGIVTVQANYPAGKLLLYQYPEENYVAGGGGTDIILRTGDAVGANRFSFRNYTNTEVASITSLGALTALTIAKTGGTSSQFLKADGSVDSSTYATTGSIGNGTLTLAVGTYLTGSASFTANQSGNTTFTVATNATSANTASTIVARDGSGNFTAGAINASYVKSPKITLDKTANTASGYNFYSETINAWQIHMAFAGGANQGYNGNLTATAGTIVTSWAMRFNVEPVAGYGWIWETIPSTTAGATTVVAELTSATGDFRTIGSVSATTLTSRVAIGTAPLTVTSTTIVANLNADLHEGFHATATPGTANTIPVRDANGYLNLNYINTNIAAENSAASDYYYQTGNDGYVRKKTLANVKVEIVTGPAVVAGLGYTPANDSAVVHIAGTETISGAKTFTSVLSVGGVGNSIAFDTLGYVGSNTIRVTNNYWLALRVNRGITTGIDLTPDDIRFSTSNINRMVILPTGVGINTIAPSEQLSVVGNIAFGNTEGKAKMTYNSTEASIDFIIN